MKVKREILAQNFVGISVAVMYCLTCAVTANDCPSICACTVPAGNESGIRALTCSGFPNAVPSSAIYLTVKLTPIHELTRSHLSPFKKLEFLDLSGIGINTTSKGAFADQSRLKILNLAENKFIYLSNYTFEDCKNLKELNLRQNGIKSIEDGIFVNLKKLQKLNLARNSLTILPSFFPPSLVELDASNNFISQLPEVDDTFLNLHRLYLCGNSYEKYQIDNFPAPNLGYLCLGGRVNFVEMANVNESLPTMRSLEIVSKSISIHHLFELLSKMPNLESLTLSDVTLKTSQPDSNFTLKKLNKLTLKGVNVHGMIRRISLFEITPNLESLDLTNSPQVSQLVLSEYDILLSVKNIKRLNLINTGTKQITPHQGSVLNQLQFLSISSNPLHCDCDFDWLVKRVFETSLYLENEAQTSCYSPPIYRDLQLLSAHVTSTMCDQPLTTDVTRITTGIARNNTDDNDESSFADVITMQHVLYAVIGLTVLVLLVLLIVLIVLCECTCSKGQSSGNKKVEYRRKYSADVFTAGTRYSYEDFSAEVAANETRVHYDCRPCSTVTFHPKKRDKSFKQRITTT